jgi:monoterpene epsilon-lactone hydrolase
MVSEAATALWDAFRAAPRMIDMPLAERRHAGEHAEDATSEPVAVTTTVRDDGSLRVEPANRSSGSVVLYCFGGGYVLGSPASRRKTAGHLAVASGCPVEAIAYRLAPEHPFPDALDDATAAFDRLLTEGFAPSQVVVAGDSAGGGLALALIVKLHADGRPLPGGYVGLSPWTDLTCSGASMDEQAAVDVECSRPSLVEMAGQYLAGHDARDPLASPVFADTAGFPPMLFVVGGDEVLLDDSLRVARQHTTAGGDATTILVGGCQHVFPIWCGVLPEADAAMSAIGAWIRHVADDASQTDGAPITGR